MNLEQVGNEILAKMKQSTEFPYKTGHLKFNATSGNLINDTTYEIKFDGKIAPYVEYLEEGTSPHDIPRAFGRDLPFGIGGKFDGKFHPGSHKHQGFISIDMVDIAIKYFFNNYGGHF